MLWSWSLTVLCFLIGWEETGRSTVADVRQNPLKNSSSEPLGGDPLFLTPLIENGRTLEARRLASVRPFQGDVVSYSGYFTVDKKHNSNLFFWYFPSEKGAEEAAPVVLWLQGGPACSSMIGLFKENGPYEIDVEGSVRMREVYWSKTMHVLYIDNPVGTGFSFTDDVKGYRSNQKEIGESLYEALLQFFSLFPELRNKRFFVVGESYAGKYVPAVSIAIHRNNPKSGVKINLKGLAVGDGWSDPVNQLEYDRFLYQIGLIDENQRLLFLRQQQIAQRAIRKKDWNSAFRDILSILQNRDSLFFNATGLRNIYNYLDSGEMDVEKYLKSFLTRKSVKEAIHVGDKRYQEHSLGNRAYRQLTQDIGKSVAPWLSVLADNYHVMMYNGQLDVVVAYPLTENYLRKLSWCGADRYLAANRSQWWVGDQLAGYVRTSSPAKCKGSLTSVLVRNAGHFAPLDQPLWIYDLISKFTAS